MNPLHETPEERVVRTLNPYPDYFCLIDLVASRALLTRSATAKILNQLEDEGLADSIMVKIDGQRVRKAFRQTVVDE